MTFQKRETHEGCPSDLLDLQFEYEYAGVSSGLRIGERFKSAVMLLKVKLMIVVTKSLALAVRIYAFFNINTIRQMDKIVT